MQIWLRAKISGVIPSSLSSRYVFHVYDSFLTSHFLLPPTWLDAAAVHLLSEVHTCTTLLPHRSKVSAAASVMNN